MALGNRKSFPVNGHLQANCKSFAVNGIVFRDIYFTDIKVFALAISSLFNSIIIVIHQNRPCLSNNKECNTAAQHVIELSETQLYIVYLIDYCIQQCALCIDLHSQQTTPLFLQISTENLKYNASTVL